MMTKRNLSAIAIVSIIIVTTIVILFWNTNKIGMCAPISRVVQLTTGDAASCLAMRIYPDYLALLDINSGEMQFHDIETLTDGVLDNSHKYEEGISNSPSSATIYITKGKYLYELNYDGSIENTISIKEFGFTAPQMAFGPILFVTNNDLWISIRGDLASTKATYSLYTWSPSSNPLTRIIELDVSEYCLDKVGNRIFFEGGIYDINTKKTTAKAWGNDYLNYMPQKGLLVSSATPVIEYDNKIMMVDPDSGICNSLIWGSCAQWGCDEYIYFMRGSTQLWRYCMATSVCEPVYKATRFVVYDGFSCQNELSMNNDRSLLAFVYKIPQTSPSVSVYDYKCGLIIINLKTLKYVDIDQASLSNQLQLADGFFISNLAWIESD